MLRVNKYPEKEISLTFLSQITTIVESIPNMLGEEYINTLTNLYDKVADGFHSVSKRAMLALVELIFDSLIPALDKIFSKDWNEKEVTNTVIATLEDYFKDIQDYMIESYVKKLV